LLEDSSKFVILDAPDSGVHLKKASVIPKKANQLAK
jgi:Fe-S cluster assembly ATPase SufC